MICNYKRIQSTCCARYNSTIIYNSTMKNNTRIRFRVGLGRILTQFIIQQKKHSTKKTTTVSHTMVFHYRNKKLSLSEYTSPCLNRRCRRWHSNHPFEFMPRCVAVGFWVVLWNQPILDPLFSLTQNKNCLNLTLVIRLRGRMHGNSIFINS